VKILQINSHYDQSGAGKIVACIHRELKKMGHDSMVAYGRGKETSDEDVIKIGSKIEVAFEGLVTRYAGINGFTSWNATRDLVKRIKDFRPDIIHLHGLHGYYLNSEILFDYINKSNIPCVWTFHDCHAFSGNCGYHYECDKWINGCFKCEHLKEYPTSHFFDFTESMWGKKKDLFTKTKNKIVVSPSNWMTNDAKKSYFGKYECITINNGIDTERVFYPRDKSECREKHGFAFDDKIVLGIAFGFADPRKGVKHIVQMSRDLEKENIKFILIGWNNKNDYLIKNLTNVVTIPVTNNQDELAEYYSLSDVFVLPSLAENYATVVIESLACGLPVVGFDVGGVPEQLAKGRGITVNVGNQEELNAAVSNILNGTSHLASKDEIINYTQNNNSISTMVEKYIDTYDKVCKK